MAENHGSPTPKLSDDQRREIASRFLAGESYRTLSEAYNVHQCTIGTALRKLGITKKDRPSFNSRRRLTSVTEFAKRARSILWRQESGAEKKSYDKWKARVEELQAGGGMSEPQALVRASKEFACLHRLFREYDLSEFDPNPDSHPEIQHFGRPSLGGQIVSEGREQTYRDSLRWAIDAAGRYLRTGDSPSICPCDAAFYIYRQAIESPKDFMAKLGQVESKPDADEEARRLVAKDGNRSIAEINSMLSQIGGDDE